MDLELHGRNVLITGGSKGIGLACAKAFAAEGAKVAISSRSDANLAAAAKMVKCELTVAADLIDSKAALRLVDHVEERLGPIDVLVSSAGAARRTAPDELDAS